MAGLSQRNARFPAGRMPAGGADLVARLVLAASVVVWLAAFACPTAIAVPVEVDLTEVPGEVVAATSTSATIGNFDASQFDELYYGVSPSGLPRAGFDLVFETFSFVEANGTVALWEASTIWNSPSGPLTVPMRFTHEVVGLGEDPWIAATDLGLPAVIGVVVANPLGIDFTVRPQFTFDVGNGFVPSDEIDLSPSGGRVGGIVGLGFFVVRPVPEPSTSQLLLVAAVLLGACARRAAIEAASA